jgi:hypothetical protein
MPLLKISNSQIIGTEHIVEANYYDGTPMVGMVGQKFAPSPEAASLTIELATQSKIELAGPHATAIWEKLSAAADDEG